MTDRALPVDPARRGTPAWVRRLGRLTDYELYYAVVDILDELERRRAYRPLSQIGREGTRRASAAGSRAYRAAARAETEDRP